MKVENENIITKKTKRYKANKKTSKYDFIKSLKKSQEIQKTQKENKVVLNVYIIAEKIANGESVSAAELDYIKENAPGLLAEAEMKSNRVKEMEKDGVQKNHEGETNKSFYEGKYNKVTSTHLGSSSENLTSPSKDQYIRFR